MALLPGIDVYNSARDAEKCEVEADSETGNDGEMDLARARVILRIGIGGVESGCQIFHDYADHASGGALLEFGFVYHGERERGIGSHAVDVCLDGELQSLNTDTRDFLTNHDVFNAFGVRKNLTFEVSNVGAVYAPALRGIECIKPEMWKAARALALDPNQPLPSTLETAVDDSNERRAKGIISRALAAQRRGAYEATTTDLDAALLAALLANDFQKCAEITHDVAFSAKIKASPTFRRRAAMAIEVRLGEKLLLDDVLAHV
jgi:hypothetical protein